MTREIKPYTADEIEAFRALSTDRDRDITLERWIATVDALLATPPAAPAPTGSAPATVRGRVLCLVGDVAKIEAFDEVTHSPALLIVKAWPGAAVGDEVEIVVRPVGKPAAGKDAQ